MKPIPKNARIYHVQIIKSGKKTFWYATFIRKKKFAILRQRKKGSKRKSWFVVQRIRDFYVPAAGIINKSDAKIIK